MTSSTQMDGPAPITPPGASTRSRRNPRLVIIGVLCAVLGALGITAVVNQVNQSHTVVSMARGVARGEVITMNDLTTVTVGALPGVSTVASTDLPRLVGQTALVDLPEGSLVASHSVGAPVVARDTAQIGLKLAAGRLPSIPMPPGTRVQLIPVSTAVEGGGAAASSTPGPATEATIVTSPKVLPDGANWILDVSVAQGDAARVAELAAAGRLVVARTQ